MDRGVVRTLTAASLLALALVATSCTGSDETYSHRVELNQVPGVEQPQLGPVPGGGSSDGFVGVGDSFGADGFEADGAGTDGAGADGLAADGLGADASTLADGGSVVGGDTSATWDTAGADAGSHSDSAAGAADGEIGPLGDSGPLGGSDAGMQDGDGASGYSDSGSGGADDTADPWLEDSVGGSADSVGSGGEDDAGDDVVAVDVPDNPPPPGMVVEWCRLMHPAVFIARVDLAETVAAHVHVPGQTDVTLHGPDPAWWLLAEVGFGARGSDPSHDPDAWTWREASVDQDPPAWVFHKHDRYLLDLTIPTPGLHDYAVRFSADAGASWKYCDLDGSQNGYDTDEAGQAEISE